MPDKKPLRQAIRQRTAGYILAGFGLVAGLAWNEAIKSLIDQFVKVPSNSLIAKFIYALIITLITVFIATYLGNLADKQK